MKVCLLSDQHGNLVDVPSCDLLLIAGDICPATNHSLEFQRIWLETNYRKWLEGIDAKKKIFICGNHDFIFQTDFMLRTYPAVYLQDSGINYENFNIYGTPWQPRFFDWAFNLDEVDLKEKWKQIPDDTDILISHGPPYGYGDLAYDYDTKKQVHVGSPSLLERIKEVKPKLVVFGHIHAGYGIYSLDDTILVNCSLLDEKYRFKNQVISLELGE